MRDGALHRGDETGIGGTIHAVEVIPFHRKENPRNRPGRAVHGQW